MRVVEFHDISHWEAHGNVAPIMTPERWKQIEKLYHSALKLEPGQRTAFLKEGCPGDEALRQEVESLLAHEPQAESTIEATAQEMAGKRVQSLVGQQFGPYKILSPLGTGGMGEVYLAQDPRLERTVALKILPTEFASDRERMQRFVREARAASALKHPTWQPSTKWVNSMACSSLPWSMWRARRWRPGFKAAEIPHPVRRPADHPLPWREGIQKT